MHKSERDIHLFDLCNWRKFDKDNVLYLATFEVMKIVGHCYCSSKRI